ncbi:hypothetical protein DXG01_001757 [Tephrocybe rancida]|nr:hypothetical protein DXG01_001757 [Tephrocybe rancida]
MFFNTLRKRHDSYRSAIRMAKAIHELHVRIRERDPLELVELKKNAENASKLLLRELLALERKIESLIFNFHIISKKGKYFHRVSNCNNAIIEHTKTYRVRLYYPGYHKEQYENIEDIENVRVRLLNL